MKIFKIIMQVGELNVSEIARRLGVNYKTTNEHLKVLEHEGIVRHKVFGRIRLFRLNESSSKGKAMYHLIEIWEQKDKQKNMPIDEQSDFTCRS